MAQNHPIVKPAEREDVSDHADAAIPVIHLIEDDPAIREDERLLFENAGWIVCEHYSAEAFLESPRPAGPACLVVDIMLPGITGLAMVEHLARENSPIPVVMLTGQDDSATAVMAMKAGAIDYIEKPPERSKLLAAVENALQRHSETRAQQQSLNAAKAVLGTLTPREHEVMMLIIEGLPNKQIAYELAINQRTVEYHRASVMRKTGSSSLPALVKLFLDASQKTDVRPNTAADLMLIPHLAESRSNAQKCLIHAQRDD
ncbi:MULTISPECIES: response regulator transcription factor [unclassified Yoonia]|uniref:response regulator transcription factor n=1 Tax=unclassified Yoonia TaxID=2629118 RepID=UPI002AFED902|nr:MULTISPECIES: response regulator [unclassified Yoonia]